MTARKTVGFGVPDEMDPHHFTVDIPAARTEPVVITEDFGLRGGTGVVPDFDRPVQGAARRLERYRGGGEAGPQ